LRKIENGALYIKPAVRWMDKPRRRIDQSEIWYLDL